MFNVRCVLFHFFHAIVKFCVVFVVEIIQRAIPVNYGRTSTEITKLRTTPTKYIEFQYLTTWKHLKKKKIAEISQSLINPYNINLKVRATKKKSIEIL